MQNYISYLSEDSRYYITLTIEEINYDSNNNTSDVSYTLTATKTSGTGYYNSYGGTVSVDINGSNVFYQRVPYDFRGSTPKTVLLASGLVNGIMHESNGKKTINVSAYFDMSSVGRGTATAAGEFELTNLHKEPSDITYTMTETNPLLVNAGISNDVFVRNLSIKSFDIQGVLYDNATVKLYRAINQIKMYSSESLPLIIDFTKNPLSVYSDEKVLMAVGIEDSLDSFGYVRNFYDYIPYSNITINEINTTVKRAGQISGKARLNIYGNYYSGQVGSVNQENYKPTLQYKFWRLGETEPQNYDYTIPEENVQINNGEFIVTDFVFGSTNENDVDYFNPDFAYRVKIKANDNFTEVVSKEKSIPVGEATWTEYKDRVDFKKITIGGAEIIESKETAMGGYSKFANGTMIQYGAFTINATLNTPWAGWYEKQVAFPDFEVPFVKLHSSNVTPRGRACWIEYNDATNLGLGMAYIARPVEDTTENIYNFDFIATGTWK